MTSIYVQFSDASKTKLVSIFGAPQDATAWPNQGVVDSSDPRYLAYYQSVPSAALLGLPPPSGQ
jgi:hypothetical protein